MYTTSTWRTAYQETINPIGVPEDSWVVPDDVRNANVVPPALRRGAGRRRKRRYETVEDKLRSSQGAQEKKRADAVDVAKRIITELHVTELFSQFVVLDFLAVD
ncbi:hypothetical protein DY000_02008228 [Brassica cretica]|uniref:Uncharacterized protein n=1 Tax=Brassica cretica TaxID=69181 RepID=A0ABQ7CGD4_BRACR|nr:hypothetical protein DY000_02008228 [Brassica cretica]